MILQLINSVRDVLEYMGGVTEELPVKAPAWMSGPIWWGAWWALLILLTLCFSGQTSKFIYIDF